MPESGVKLDRISAEVGRLTGTLTAMAINPQIPDPIDEGLRRLLADPEIAADLDAYVARRARGELGPGVPHDEVGGRLGLLTEGD